MTPILACAAGSPPSPEEVSSASGLHGHRGTSQGLRQSYGAVKRRETLKWPARLCPGRDFFTMCGGKPEADESSVAVRPTWRERSVPGLLLRRLSCHGLRTEGPGVAILLV